jgi:hypothetical protein
MARAAPTDADRVLCALRLGWAVSELRGRLRPGNTLIEVKQLEEGARTAHALPLGGERTPVEQLIEAEAVVCALAARLEVDCDIKDFRDADGTTSQAASIRLVELAKELARVRARKDAPDEQRSWDEMANFLYQWDAKIQDQLAGDQFNVASAYQLGRGLGEIAWLDPTQDAADDSTSWAFVLSSRRVGTLQRLVKRLAEYFQPLTATGVSVALGVWGKTVKDDTLRESPACRIRLTEQTRRWRDVLLTGLDPATLLPPSKFLARARQIRHVLRSFWPELVIAVAGAGLTALAAALLASTDNHSLGAFLGVLGLSSITTSGVVAKARTQALALIGKLRDALDADLIVDAVVVQPKPPERKRMWLL